MAVYNKATRTAKGRAYDASVNANEFQAQYSFMYISSHDYTATDIDALTEIEDIVIKAGVSDIKKNSDVAVSVYAPYTNAGRKTSFELRTVGLMATHPTDGLILHSVVTASVPDTVPEDDGANLVDETFQFILEEVNADNTLLKGDPSGLITVDIFNQYKTETTNQMNQTTTNIYNTIEEKKQTRYQWYAELPSNSDSNAIAGFRFYRLEDVIILSYTFGKDTIPLNTSVMYQFSLASLPKIFQFYLKNSFNDFRALLANGVDPNSVFYSHTTLAETHAQTIWYTPSINSPNWGKTISLSLALPAKYTIEGNLINYGEVS